MNCLIRFFIIFKFFSGGNNFAQSILQFLSTSEVVSKEIECSRCELGCFSCNGTDQCVPQRKNCDGTVDCDNGFDENKCGKHESNKILHCLIFFYKKGDEVGDEYWNHLYRKTPSAEIDTKVCGK